jgi:replicative DNA helicase
VSVHAVPAEFERTPPQDLDAEQSVLGGVLLSKDAVADVVEVLRGSDFYRPAHQLVFDAVLDLYSKGEPVDPVTVAAELTRTNQLARIGGAPYLHTLVASVPTAANAGFYAQIVAEKAILRRLVEAGTRIVQMGFGGGEGNVDQVVDRAQAEVFQVTERRAGEDVVRLEELLNPTLEEIEAIEGRDGQMAGVPTGFADFDRLTNGLHPGQLVVVAARPGLGKSTLALDFCRAASVRHGQASVVFSLEMSKSEITMRLLSAEARVHLQHMRAGRMTEDDWGRLARRMGEVANAPLFVDDSPHLTMMEIRAKARRLKQRHDLKLVVIDYLQLMSSPRKVESRQQEVSEISRSLKLLAKELQVPVVALSQLNRSSEQRADKRPQLSDLRESGAIEQDADVVILLHRDDAYEKDSTRAGEADLIVAKHRNGPTDTVTVAFQGHYSRFVDMSPAGS